MRKGLVPLVLGLATGTGALCAGDAAIDFAVGTTLKEKYSQVTALENRIRNNQGIHLGYTESELDSFRTSIAELKADTPELSSYYSKRKNMVVGLAGLTLAGAIAAFIGLYRVTQSD